MPCRVHGAGVGCQVRRRGAGAGAGCRVSFAWCRSCSRCSPLLHAKIGLGLGRVSPTPIAQKTKKKRNSAIAMAAAMAPPSATRNATAIWWRFFKFPQRYSAMAPPWSLFDNTDSVKRARAVASVQKCSVKCARTLTFSWTNLGKEASLEMFDQICYLEYWYFDRYVY